MEHAKRRWKCPHCGGLDTKRHGQAKSGHARWYCKQCRHTFSPHDQQLSARGTALYFDSEASYRAVGRDLGITPKAIWRRIISLGFNCKSPMETSVE